MYIDKSLKQYIDDVSSEKSMPGGGSVAALVGSLGAALTNMVMNLTKDKKVFKELDENIQTAMIEGSKEIDIIRKELNKIIDEDTRAFNSVLEAFRLPKITEKEILKRQIAIEEGYKKALSVPLKCMELSLSILEKQKIFAAHGNQGLITDVGIGSILAYSAIESSKLNVKINLNGIKDEKYRKEIEEKINSILKEGKKLKEESLDIVYRVI